jgi:hypothetical protein
MHAAAIGQIDDEGMCLLLIRSCASKRYGLLQRCKVTVGDQLGYWRGIRPGRLGKIFDYIPAMFVLTFIGGSGSSGGFSQAPASFTLMLGTASKNGLACSIQGGGTPRFAVSILPFP